MRRNVLAAAVVCVLFPATPPRAPAQEPTSPQPCPGTRYRDALELRVEASRLVAERELPWGQGGLPQPLVVRGGGAYVPTFAIDAAGERLWLQDRTLIAAVELATGKVATRGVGGGSQLLGSQHGSALLLERFDRTADMRLARLAADGSTAQLLPGLLPRRGAVARSGELGVLIDRQGIPSFVDLLGEEVLWTDVEPKHVGSAVWNDRETRIALEQIETHLGKRIGIRVVDPQGGVLVRIASRGTPHAIDFAPDDGALYWSDLQARRTDLRTGRTLQVHDAAQQWWLTVDDALAVSHDGERFTAWVAERMQPVWTAPIGGRARAAASAPDRRRFAIATDAGIRVYRVATP